MSFVVEFKIYMEERGNVEMKKKNILIIDDNLDMGKSLQFIFDASGYDTALVYNGADAIKKIKEKSFNVVLSDLIMEGMSGIETVQKIKQIKANILFFMMTAYPSETTLQEALKEGVKKVFVKPFDVEEMINAIDNELRSKKYDAN
jgi:two-component system response regulator (stage 0 sporulation protein F)